MVWIVEAQAARWEPRRVVNTARSDGPSLGPVAMPGVVSRMWSVRFNSIPMWGIEHWYMRKKVYGDPKWWASGGDLLAGRAE